MSQDLLIVVPILHRPQRVAPLVASIRDTAPDARVVFAVSPGDDAVHAAVDAAGEQRVTVPWHGFGDYARKVNTVYRRTTEPWIFFASDDLRFHPNWWQAAAAKLTPGVGVVGTNDLGSPRVMRGEHATHALVTREYADRFGLIDAPGMILYEGYQHEYCDDELVGTAKKRGAWAFAADAHVEHMHPNWGKALDDDQFHHQQGARMRASIRLFQQRRALWT